MKAIQMTEQGGPEVLRLVELPDPQPGPGQALIRVESAAVNFSDVMRRRGDVYPVATPSPFVPGAEVAGTVVALGPGVDGPAVGTKVFGTVGADASGGYAELALAYAPSVIPIPEGLDSDAAAGIVVTGLAATVILTELIGLGKGQSVFIPAAAGGVGQYAVQIAKLLGADTVIAGASTPAKRQIALDLGADHAIDYTQEDWPEEVRELTGGVGVDGALEMSGPARLAQTLRALAPFGRLVVLGSVSGTTEGLDPAALSPLLYDPAPSQSLIGFNLGIWFEHRLPEAGKALHRLVGWVASGEVRTPATQTLPLAEAAEAHRLLETGQTTGKLILKP
ncbi:quinone oxidoreductase family protein [Actinacidiphila soli]|jgi:NADPH:quinone reductase-like Zn-dependent oxidoreductase|uniref:quinone oxidoreductase family protein n=1 Tax=Actinacidiphila soli TaxID=2487275 RepID=UPI000FCC6C9D|nr:zinc-binding dehydrogenase [Actinacidiphila soli]